MPRIRYNLIAGQSLERLAAISDGIFGVAMTLLVLNLQVPASTAAHTIHSEADLLRALALVLPSLLTYMMSFLTAGIFWIGQQTQLNHFTRVDRHLSWIHFAFLFCVSMLPFSTALLAGYIHFHTALVVYWLNILALGAVLLASWRYAIAARLIDPEAPPGVSIAVQERIIHAQILYAVGAALCVFSNYFSIAVIVLVQLNYAVAPLSLIRSIIRKPVVSAGDGV